MNNSVLCNKRAARFFKVALRASTLSTHATINIGAVIAHKNSIIATGANTLKTHPLQRYHNVKRFSSSEHGTANHTIHAEMNAIQKAVQQRINLAGASMYVARMYKHNKYGMCRPCAACMNAIRVAGIQNIFYTTPDGFAHETL